MPSKRFMPWLALLLGGFCQPALAAEIHVGFTQDALTLDPGNPGNRDTETIIRNIYDGLLTRDAAMRVVPEIASSYAQPSPTVYEFKLRDDVRFHDGTPLTAEDVKFTFERILSGRIGGQTNPRKDLLGPLERVEIVDARTVRFVLKAPWPLLPAMLPFQEIVSEAFVKKVGDAGMVSQTDGTGPFKLVEWRRGDEIVMERAPDYYGGSPDIPPVGPARVDRVIFKVMPDNASRVAALLGGDVDIINSLPVSAIRQVEASPNARVVTVNGTRSFFLAINNDKAPFTDKRVRQALNHAVDRKLIIARLLNGNATPLNGVLSPDAFGFDPNLPEYAYDPGRAKALLAEAGAAALQLTIDTDGASKEIAEAIASMMQRSGVQAKVQVWETAVIVPIWRDAGKRRDHDLFLSSWGNASLDPSDIVMPTIRSGGRANISGYANPEVDMLLDAAEVELDALKRKALYMRAQEIVNADAPWVFLWLPKDIYGLSKRLRNWQPAPDGKINLHRATVE
jgi:peptide/nickel transport system substrate-binding protein